MSGGLLVFGGAGQIGLELIAAARHHDIDVTSPTRAEIDIRDEAAVIAAVTRAAPRLVINLAAYTDVDGAESDPDLAAAINRDAAGSIARAAAAYRVPILHLSTDYVFDGTKSGAYHEDDAIGPVSAYGRTKAEGEDLVRSVAERHIILRTAWVYGVHRKNFLKTMLRLARDRDHLRVVADQHGCPTATRDLAAAILAVDARLATDETITGTFHFAGLGATTWHEFAELIVDAQAAYTGKRPFVEAIATVDYPTPAQRPKNSVLNSGRFVSTFAYRAQDWRMRTQEVVATLLGGT